MHGWVKQAVVYIIGQCSYPKPAQADENTHSIFRLMLFEISLLLFQHTCSCGWRLKADVPIMAMPYPHTQIIPSFDVWTNIIIYLSKIMYFQSTYLYWQHWRTWGCIVNVVSSVRIQ